MIKFNIQKLRELIEKIYLLSGIKVSIFDENQNEILYYPDKYSSYCKLIRSTEKGTSICLAADKRRFDECKKTGKALIYECPFGLTEIFSPILIKGVVVGFITLGQIVSEKTNVNFLIDNASRLGLDRENVQNAINCSEKKKESVVVACSFVLEACAKYVYVDRYIEIKNDEFANKITEYIQNNIREKITVDSLCGEFHISRASLYKVFKSYVGTTIADYLKKLRIEKARELLSETNMLIREIAIEVGHDYNYFTKVFTMVTGVTPKKYQLMNSKKSLK